MSLRLQLLGSVELFYKGQRLEPLSDRKSLALLCYLAVKESAVNREELAELLWGTGKLNNLRQALYKLRQLAGADDWLIDEDAVGLKVTTDLGDFEGYLKENKFEEALALWQGGLLADFRPIKSEPFMNWLELERSLLLSLYDEASLSQLESLEAKAEFGLALKLAYQLLETDPLNETLHRSVMRLEHARGNTEAALEQFEKLRQLLKEELELEPLDETLELLAEIEQGGAGSNKLAQVIDQQDAMPHLAELFLGRAELISSAQDLLKQEKRLLIQGFGGMGKSALAAQLAQGYLNQGKVLWLELGQTDSATLVNALLKVFEVPQDAFLPRNPKTLIPKLLNDAGIALIVLDDVWNAYTLSTLLELFPAMLATLITSRQRYPKLKRIQLGRLERSESLSLLSHYAERDLTEQADALCDHLGDHAYALRVAGINLKLTGLTPDELLETIKNAPHDLRIPPEMRAEDQGSIAQLLKVSLEALDEGAYEAFLGFGALPRGSATPELLERLLNRESEYLEEALFNLSQHGLASRNTVSGSDKLSYQLHNLAYSYSKAINNARFKTLLHAVKSYLEAFTYQAQAVDLELQTILRVAEQTEGQNLVELMRLLVLEGSYFLSEAHSPGSLGLLEQAAKQAEPQLSHEFLAKIGNYYLNSLGLAEQAFPYFEQAYEVAKKLGSRQRQAVYQCLMAVVLLRRNDAATANVFETAYGLLSTEEVSLDSAIVLANYGYFYAIQGKFEQARDLFEASLKASSSLTLDSESERLESARISFFALNNLAQTLQDLQHYEESILRRSEALELAKVNHNNLWMADAYYGLGESYHALFEKEKAELVFLEALQRYEALRAEAYVSELKAFMNNNGYELPKSESQKDLST